MNKTKQDVALLFASFSTLFYFSGCYGCSEVGGVCAQEYQANWGLAAIGAQHAYQRGLSGAGVHIGIVDTGLAVEHPEFAGRGHVGLRTRVPGIFVNGQDGLTDGAIDPSNHGSQVGGVIAAAKDGQGMHGVAYKSRLISASAELSPFLNALDRCIWLDTLGLMLSKSRLALADQNVRVINNSVVYSEWHQLKLSELAQKFRRNSEHPIIQSAVTVARKGVLQVWAAGNHVHRERDEPLKRNVTNSASLEAVLPHFLPELENTWITVVAVGADNKILASSNRCGVAAEWCVAAPGGDDGVAQAKGIMAPTTDYLITPKIRAGGVRKKWGMRHSYEKKSGTSMAAPHVTGSIALLMERFSYLDVQHIREVLLTTTTPLGDVQVYGQGLINVAKAIRGPSRFRKNFKADLPRGLNDVWDNVITGSGGLVKEGEGSLAIYGDHSYTGLTEIRAGQLSINGQIVSPLTVQVNGELRGAGTLRGITKVAGTLAPGNSPGTLNIAAPLILYPGSQIIFDIDGLGTGSGAGNYSRVIVLGDTATLAGTLIPRLRHIPGSASNTFTPARGSRFDVLWADGGVNGGFDLLVQPEGLSPGTRFDFLYQLHQGSLIVSSNRLPGMALGGNAGAGAQALNVLRDYPIAWRDGPYNRWLGQAIDANPYDSTYRTVGGQIYADILAWGADYQNRIGQFLFDRLAGMNHHAAREHCPSSAIYREQSKKTPTAAPVNGKQKVAHALFDENQLSSIEEKKGERKTGEVSIKNEVLSRNEFADTEKNACHEYGSRYTIWAYTPHSRLHHRAELTELDVSAHAEGMVAGGEINIGQRSRIGIALGALKGDLTQADGASSNLNAYAAHLYGRYYLDREKLFLPAPYLVMGLAYMDVRAETQRAVTSLLAAFRSTTRSRHMSAEIGVGATQILGGWQINPELVAKYGYKMRPGKMETTISNDDFVLNLDNLRGYQVSLSGQVRMRRSFEFLHNTVVPQLIVGYEQFLKPNAISTATFSNQYQMAIAQRSATANKQRLRLGVQLPIHRRALSIQSQINYLMPIAGTGARGWDVGLQLAWRW